MTRAIATQIVDAMSIYPMIAIIITTIIVIVVPAVIHRFILNSPYLSEFHRVFNVFL